MLASASKLWNNEQGKAIEFGNLIHEMMAKIITKKDVETIVNKYEQEGIINKEQAKAICADINKIVNHVELQNYYSNNVTIYNEREIVDVDNQIMIPDRLVVENDVVTIIDYKTGKNVISRKALFSNDLTDLQLPIYACFTSINGLSGVAIGHINRGKINLYGVLSSDNNTISKQLSSKIDNSAIKDWHSLTNLWRNKIENIVEQYLSLIHI